MLRPCDACGTPYEARSTRSKFCAGPECKRARERRRKSGAGTADVVPFPEQQAADNVGPNERVTRKALEDGARLESVAGVNALTLARQLDHAQGESGSAFTALAKQHLASVDRALEGAKAEGDAIDQRQDELSQRRERRLVGRR